LRFLLHYSPKASSLARIGNLRKVGSPVRSQRVSLINLRGNGIMSRRIAMSLAASVIIGIGFVGTISTDASAYYRGGAYRGGVYRGGVYRGGVYRGVRPGVAVGIGAAAVGAAAVGAAAAGAYYAPGYYGAPAPVGCPYGYYYYAPYNRCVPTP
jgi:hypothetical protein